MGLEDQFESLQMTTGGLIQEWLPSTEGYVQGREASMESEESTFEPAHVQLIGVEWCATWFSSFTPRMLIGNFNLDMN